MKYHFFTAFGPTLQTLHAKSSTICISWSEILIEGKTNSIHTAPLNNDNNDSDSRCLNIDTENICH